MSKIVDMIHHIDKAEAAAWKGEPMVKRRTYTPEQQEKLDFFKSMASAYCVQHGHNPDELVDTIASPVPGLTGAPDIVSMARWECVVDQCAEAHTLFEAWFGTRQDRVAFIEAKNAREAEMEREANDEAQREMDETPDDWFDDHDADDHQVDAAVAIAQHEATNEVKH